MLCHPQVDADPCPHPHRTCWRPSIRCATWHAASWRRRGGTGRRSGSDAQQTGAEVQHPGRAARASLKGNWHCAAAPSLLPHTLPVNGLQRVMKAVRAAAETSVCSGKGVSSVCFTSKEQETMAQRGRKYGRLCPGIVKIKNWKTAPARVRGQRAWSGTRYLSSGWGWWWQCGLSLTQAQAATGAAAAAPAMAVSPRSSAAARSAIATTGAAVWPPAGK